MESVFRSAELEALVARARSLAAGMQFVEASGLAEDALHVYARKRAGESLRGLLGDEVPRLAAAVRRLGEESAALRQDLERARSGHDAPPPRTPEPATAVADSEGLGGLLSAPFHVTAATASAARTDPLLALAVQVARALGEGAKELERARLIAMAFAATRGDMDAFWAARRQRSGLGQASPKAAKKKKG